MKKKENKRYLTLKEIQYEETKMLREVDLFLKKHKITYYLWAGTLLGAVRHKGFIPWDDDVDLAMPRPEYNKFIDCLKKHNNKITEDLIVEGFELGNNNDFPILKVYNKNIKVDDEKEKVDKFLWIDIFPLDGTPKDNKKYYKKCRFLYKILLLKREQKNNVSLMAKNKTRRIIKNVGMFILRIWKYDSFLKFYCKYCSKYDYNKCDYVNYNIMADCIEVYEKKDFTVREIEFCNLKVNGIKKYDKILSLNYGNYMELPPKEKRISHKIKAWKINK